MNDQYPIILFVDTETGGTDPHRHQLLSIGLVEWKQGVLSNEKQILINDSDYSVTEEALKINKIDLKLHEKHSLLNKDAFKVFIEYLTEIAKPNLKIVIAGHNVMFDVNFIKSFFSNNNSNFYNYFSHRVIDTYSILSFLNFSGYLNGGVYNSDKAFREFDINVNGRHTALGDAIATAVLFNKMLSIVAIDNFKLKTTDNTR